MSHTQKQDYTTDTNTINYNKVWQNIYNTLEQAPEKSMQALTYMWNRVPNAKETITIVVPTAMLEMLIGDDIIKQLGNNPGNKNVFRDSVKTLSIFSSYLTGAKLGGTETKYDLGHVIGQGYKAGCKFLYMTLSHKPLKESAKEANYICDTTARIFPLASQLRQSENTTDINYAYDLGKRIMTTPLLLQVAAQGILKSGIADKVGKVIESSEIETQLANSLSTAQVAIIKLASDIPYSSTLLQHTTEFIKKGTIGSIITVIYTPPVRIVQDSVPIVSKPIESWLELSKSYFLEKFYPQQHLEKDIWAALENDKGREVKDETSAACEDTCVNMLPIETDHSDSTYDADGTLIEEKAPETINIELNIAGEAIE